MSRIVFYPVVFILYGVFYISSAFGMTATTIPLTKTYYWDHPENNISPIPQETPTPKTWHIDFTPYIYNDLPFSIGIAAELSFRDQVSIWGSFGFIPSFYADLLGSLYSDPDLGKLVADTVTNTPIIALGTRIYPLKSFGFFAELGYCVGFLENSTSATELYQLIYKPKHRIGQTLAEGAITGLKSVIHTIRAGVGWKWQVYKKIEFLLSLNYTEYLFSDNTVTLVSSLNQNTIPYVEAVFEDFYDQYIHLPTINMMLGWEF